MQTFKCFFRVVLANAKQTTIFTGIFVVIAILMGAPGGGQDAMFERVSANIGFVNRDNHPISDGLLEHLGTLHTLVPSEDNISALEDAIFFERVRYVLIIDEGFGASFARGENFGVDSDESRESRARPGRNPAGLWNIAAPHNSAISVFIERQIDSYLMTKRAYLAAQFNYAQAAYLARHDLAQEVNIRSPFEHIVPTRYFDSLVFIAVALVVISLAPTLTVFKKKDIAGRLQVSPEPARKRTLALALGSICLTLMIWVMLMIPAYFFHHESLFNLRGVLHMLNTLALAIMCVGLAVLLVQLISNTDAILGATVMIGVIFGFGSGAFVPMEMMGEQMRVAASFTPGFWYGHSNLMLIRSLTEPGFSGIDMPEYWLGIGIQLGFAAAMFALALLLGGEKNSAG